MNFEQLNQAVKFAAGESGWPAFASLFEREPQIRWGGEEHDHTRKVAADAYQEHTGDEEGANLLRDPNQHVVVHEGKVKKGVFGFTPIHRALRAVQDHIQTVSRNGFDPARPSIRTVPNSGGQVLYESTYLPDEQLMDLQQGSVDQKTHVTKLGEALSNNLRQELDRWWPLVNHPNEPELRQEGEDLLKQLANTKVSEGPEDTVASNLVRKIFSRPN